MVFAGSSASCSGRIFFFQNILQKLKDLFINLTRWNIGNYKEINFWYDAWGEGPLGLTSSSDREQSELYISLQDAFNVLNSLIPRPLTASRWLLQFDCDFANSGELGFTSVYLILARGAKVTLTIILFFVLLMIIRVLTQEIIARRNLNLTSGCQLREMVPQTYLNLCPTWQPGTELQNLAILLHRHHLARMRGMMTQKLGILGLNFTIPRSQYKHVPIKHIPVVQVGRKYLHKRTISILLSI